MMNSNYIASESTTPTGYSYANDDASSQIAINTQANNQALLNERVNVNLLVKSRAILLKTLAEERQRYCIWILVIVMSILLTFIPSIISLVISLITMDPDAGPKLIQVQLATYYSKDNSMYDYAYTTYDDQSCCNKRSNWQSGGYSINCPIADFNFLMNYEENTDENVLGYINLYNSSAGLLDNVYHPCNRETPTSICKTSPTFIKDKSINPAEILKSAFQYNDTIKTFNSIINVKKSEKIKSNLDLNLEITSYYKNIYNQLISLISQTIIDTLPANNYNPITNTTINVSQPPSTSALIAAGVTDFIPLITLGIIPICLSLLFPLFIESFAQDRTNGMMELIELYGITGTLHSVIKTCFFYGIYLIYVIAQIVIGLAFQNPFFLKNNAAIYISALLIWGVTIISIANVISVFKVTSGYFIGFCLLIFGFLGSIVAIFVFSNSIMPYYLLLIPPIAFLRILLLMILPNMLVPIEGNYGDQLVIAYAFLIGVTLIVVLAVPVTNLFVLLFKKLYKLVKAKQLSQETMKLKNNLNNNRNYSTENTTPIDADRVADDTVERETQFVLQNSNMDNNVIEVRHLTKRYGSKLAVNNVTFCIPRGICFGLLGNNGAGKTTTVNCILGLEFPYEGVCTLSGKDINSTDSNILATRIGCVHQFDRFFGITVLDQLRFFAAIKGIPRKLIDKHIDEILQDVGLTEARRRNCKDLSGGMQRRLSLAIAMIGKPELLILDEVTGGLDPLSAHGIHMILKKYMEDKNRAILTLTHSMEETEILCDKVGILVNGEMKTIGSLHELKTKYGKGYKLYVQTTSTDHNNVAKEYVKQALIENGIPSNCISHNETFANRLEFRIANHQNDSKKLLETLFKVMTRKEAKHAFIVDWTCTMASLEEVFIRKVKWQYENDTIHN